MVSAGFNNMLLPRKCLAIRPQSQTSTAAIRLHNAVLVIIQEQSINGEMHPLSAMSANVYAEKYLLGSSIRDAQKGFAPDLILCGLTLVLALQQAPPVL